MNIKIIGIGFVLLIHAICFPYVTKAQDQTGERAQWFVNDRYGMFIHWGIYSGAEGIWKGEKLRHGNNYAEWIQYRNRIPNKEYLTLLEHFDWESIDPEQWVLLAKRSGMKYVTLTAKHHDGFALWDSKSSPYNITNYSNGRDIVKEFALACKKHGLKLGLYYSHWVDWEHLYGWDHIKEVYPITAANYDTYWQEKVMPQMQELLTNYGEIGLIWFDMWKHHSETIVTKEQLIQLKKMIRKLQPDCLINSRLGLSIEEDSDVDFRTLSDNQLGTEKLEYPWQTPATVAHSWGFNAYENQWKSTTALLRNLIGNVSLNGNMMLNIGPRANGDVPYEISSRLSDMGEWLGTNGESIYGAGAFDLRSDIHDWGNITFKETPSGKAKVYLHVFNWPLKNELPITGIKIKPSKVYALANTKALPLDFKHMGALTKINLPHTPTDPFVSVIVMEFDKRPEVEKGLVAVTVSDGYSFIPDNTKNSEGNATLEKSSRFGTVPRHVVIKEKQLYTWKIFVDEPSEYVFDVSYWFQGNPNGSNIRLTIDGQELEHMVKPTGKTVGEPRQNWILENYKSHRMGSVNLDKVGYYDIRVEIVPENDKEIKFQWIWLEKK